MSTGAASRMRKFAYWGVYPRSIRKITGGAIRPRLLQQLVEGRPVELGHVEVGEHEIVAVPVQQGHHVRLRRRGIHRVAGFPEDARGLLALPFVVVHHQDPTAARESALIAAR